jgi:hypothetical protein
MRQRVTILAVIFIGAASLLILKGGEGGRAGIEPLDSTKEQALRDGSEPDETGQADRVDAAVHAEAGAVGVAPTPTTVETIRGIVRDTEGEPIIGVDVVSKRSRYGPINLLGASAPQLQSESFVAVTRGDGQFEGEVPATGHWLNVTSEHWVAVRVPRVTEENKHAPFLIVVAPRTHIRGYVTDTTGAGLMGARLELSLSRGAFLTTNLDLEGTSLAQPLVTTSGAAGRFEFVHAPVMQGVLLDVSLDGYQSARLDTSLGGEEILTVVLERGVPPTDDPSWRVVHGTVRNQKDDPVAGATVRFGSHRTESDEFGAYRLRVPPRIRLGVSLVATKRGLSPGIVREFGTGLLDQPDVIRQDIRMPGSALSISGRVRHSDGTPAEGWRVFLLDDTLLETTSEKTLEEASHSEPNRIVTSASGEFLIGGLSSRAYRIRAYRPSSLVAVDSLQIEAGSTDVEIVIPQQHVGIVRGRVISKDGAAMADISVELVLDTRNPTGPSSFQLGPKALSDSNGEFIFEGAPLLHARFRTQGARVVSETHSPSGPFDASPLEFVVTRRRRLQYHWQGIGEEPRMISVLNQWGETLPVYTHEQDSLITRTRQPLTEGRSLVVSVSEDAETIVLYSGTRRDALEIARISIEWTPGVTVIAE